ncbi:MAG: hydantoinase/oxoprolinase family protein [Actinomycetota bacterium]
MGERLRVGIDVGGTNTDAVAIDDAGVVWARIKEPTTADPTDGILAALRTVTAGHEIDRVALGTTHAVNAIVQRRGLRRVAIVRIGAPGTLAVPPCTGWPADLVATIVGPVLIARGGVEVDGRIHPLAPDELRRFAVSLDADVDAVAITGTFSPLDASQEEEAAAIVAAGSGLPISLGHRIGGLGLLERENATVLNAALGDVIERVVDGLEAAIATIGPHVHAYLTQNDGTLMTPGVARETPVLTIGSGPSNSLRGAATLTGRTDVLVADVGGTSTDIGALTNGFPRESSAGVTVGGVRTNFRMPDLVSVAVGGGTTIVDGQLSQRSVARRIREDALVFGGSIPTLTDAAVAAGRVAIGDVVRVAGRDDLAPALGAAETVVADAIDRMRLSSAGVDLALVGGGGVLLPDAFPGVRAVVRPEHGDVANAIGAALAPVAGEAELIADVGGERRRAEIERCLDDARERAIAAGADGALLETIWVEETPLAYLDRPLSRIRAKVAGPVVP